MRTNDSNMSTIFYGNFFVMVSSSGVLDGKKLLITF